MTTNQFGLAFRTLPKTRTVHSDGRTVLQLMMVIRLPIGLIYSRKIVLDGIVDRFILEILILIGKLIRAFKNKDSYVKLNLVWN